MGSQLFLLLKEAKGVSIPLSVLTGHWLYLPLGTELHQANKQCGGLAWDADEMSEPGWNPLPTHPHPASPGHITPCPG